MENDKVPQPMAELTYIPKGSTKNLPVVSEEISEEHLDSMAERIRLYNHMERRLGEVRESTCYYHFEGDHYFLKNGNVQVGRAVTSDNQKGFKMIRLFANSIEESESLQREIGVFDGVKHE